MTVMPSLHWTKPRVALALVCGVTNVAIAIFGFIDLYLTVTHLVASSWHSWSWTVILLGEGAFMSGYCGWLLLDLFGKTAPRIRILIACYLGLFALGSFGLQGYAGRGSVPAFISHMVVSLSFFGSALFAKVIVKALSADPQKEREAQALADARRYALDLLHAMRGPLWRFRVPSLLRTQILRCRFPDEVRLAVIAKAGVGGWQKDVRGWVLGLDGLNIHAQAKADSERARQGLTTPAEVPVATPAEPPAETALTTPAKTPAAPPSQHPSRKGPKRSPRQVPDAELADLLVPLLNQDPDMSIGRAMEHTGTARPRARRVLELARAEAAKGADVIQMTAR